MCYSISYMLCKVFPLLALCSSRGGKNLDDLSNLMTAVNADNVDIERIFPLLRAVLCKASDKDKLGQTHVGVPGFFDAFFGEVAGLGTAAQAEERGWKGWPEGAGERDVLSWFALLTEQLLDSAEEHWAGPRLLQGSTADCKLDIGFVDNESADINSRYHWSRILVPGELKSNPLADKASKAWLDLGQYAGEVLAAQDSRRFIHGFTLCGSLMRLWSFDRLGAIASEQFDINKDGLQFVSAVLGFLWTNRVQLGLDPTITTAGDKRYIEIEQDNRKERLVIDKVIKRVACVAGRATTCWRVHREDDPNTPLVVKDSWQYPACEEEGELLHGATEKGVMNVARYFHHETVRVGGRDDDIHTNVRRGLDITKAKNYAARKPMPPLSTTGYWASQKDGSSVTGRKQSSSCTDAPLPPSKRTCLTSPTKPAITNRVHRRVIVHDYGKPIYKASSRASLLAGLEGCIEGYESLHTRAGMLQCDISPNNLMVNEDENNASWPAFLIDLDHAIKEQCEQASGARGKTGTRAFMAIGVLPDDGPHSFMHDLESFFWVLFWICIHYDGPDKHIGPSEFECWNYENDQKLAGSKKSSEGRCFPIARDGGTSACSYTSI
ncbi:hypothetical protein BU25DRAFT_433594 [Macroventuria anomochaeta]|uniref:Uncharacterized protein n=1 Tax=Macroventuria anomochaeta TaxID=301207 RepID=A0ACB6RTA4_9PLEO|nr:uncharacterized protein BU25DRAFT_433594 [Macroventuria anomochaeta]KAF2624368.1 hypothetical protein BU25DRAFT_433594 [Macroventuria anomochaeta]